MFDLKALHDSDFGPSGPFVVEYAATYAQDGSDPVELRLRAHLNHEANSLFISCYIPAQPDPEWLIRAVCRDRGPVAVARSLNVKHRFKHTTPETSSADICFTGRVWIYFEGLLDDTRVLALQEEARVQDVSLFIRDWRYAEACEVMATPVAFLCHDSADKQTVAVPLARALRHNGVSVWLDKERLKPGDSLRERIEQGIRDSKKFILLVSPNFLVNRRWANDEYSAVFALEKARAERMIVPVWCGVTELEVAQQVPFLADRFAVIWDGDATSTARKLAAVFQ